MNTPSGGWHPVDVRNVCPLPPKAGRYRIRVARAGAEPVECNGHFSMLSFASGDELPRWTVEGVDRSDGENPLRILGWRHLTSHEAFHG